MARETIGQTLDLAEGFEEHRPHLMSVAYRMLGSVEEAEDVVQDAWLRLRQASPEEVRSARAYLVTVVSRISLDRLKSARARHETYVGPWLPEPQLTGLGDPEPQIEENLIMRESLSLAFLTLLESLNPLERAVFLLHEVFDYSYPETAEILGRSESTCRQAYSRARKALVAKRPRFETSFEERRRLLEQFLKAAAAGDMEGLTEVLAEDVTVWSDGGGKANAALQPIVGRDKIIRFFLGPAARAFSGTFEIEEINGEPGLVARTADGVYLAMTAEFSEGRIAAMRSVLNPEKLGHVQVIGDYVR